MNRDNKNSTWIKKRHKIVWRVVLPIVSLYTRLRFGVQVERFEQRETRPYLILMNHQTSFDQFFVAMAFGKPIYFMATEDIFSLGWISSLLRYFLAPIPIKKQTTDLAAVRSCMRVSREGGSIAIAPEGNRTYNGKTVYINPAIASLIKMLRLPVALFRIEGGYGVQPRWSDVVRKGRMHARVSRVIEPEDYAKLSNDALYEMILQELNVDEARVMGKFHHEKRAEYLERAIYVCPECGLAEFESRNDLITCKKCGLQARYLPTMELQGVNCDFPFRFVADWYDYQCAFINRLDPSQHFDAPMYTDAVRISEVIVNQRKLVLDEHAGMELYGDRICVKGPDCGALSLHFNDVSTATVLGRNKLNVYCGDKVYQFKGDKRFNALKYMNIWHRYRNTCKEDGNGEFLGL